MNNLQESLVSTPTQQRVFPGYKNIPNVEDFIFDRVPLSSALYVELPETSECENCYTIVEKPTKKRGIDIQNLEEFDDDEELEVSFQKKRKLICNLLSDLDAEARSKSYYENLKVMKAKILSASDEFRVDASLKCVESVYDHTEEVDYGLRQNYINAKVVEFEFKTKEEWIRSVWIEFSKLYASINSDAILDCLIRVSEYLASRTIKGKKSNFWKIDSFGYVHLDYFSQITLHQTVLAMLGVSLEGATIPKIKKDINGIIDKSWHTLEPSEMMSPWIRDT